MFRKSLVCSLGLRVPYSEFPLYNFQIGSSDFITCKNLGNVSEKRKRRHESYKGQLLKALYDIMICSNFVSAYRFHYRRLLFLPFPSFVEDQPELGSQFSVEDWNCRNLQAFSPNVWIEFGQGFEACHECTAKRPE